MIQIIPVASGKGGVGKSVLSVNLAIALAQMGKRVILCDFDFGGANLHTMLGMKNTNTGLGHLINKQEDEFEDLVLQTSIENLGFIPGDCLIPGTANMDYFSKRKILKGLNKLDADYAILDLAAGSTYNTLDFFLTTNKSFMVTTAEVTSILNAYSFLKSSMFRFFGQQFSAKSDERKFINEYYHRKLEGTEISFKELVNEVYENFPDKSPKVINKLEEFRPQVILNRGKTSKDIDMGHRLRSLVKNKLNMNMEFIGFLPEDDEVSLSIARRKPLILSNPDGAFATQVRQIANRVVEESISINENWAE